MYLYISTVHYLTIGAIMVLSLLWHIYCDNAKNFSRLYSNGTVVVSFYLSIVCYSRVEQLVVSVCLRH